MHQAVNESVLRQEERERIYAQYMEEAAGAGGAPGGAGGDPAGEEDAEEDPGEYMSCIGRRKRCLVERDCRETLTDFRLHCKENKKKNVCVSTDPWVVYFLKVREIEYLHQKRDKPYPSWYMHISEQ